MTAPRPEPWPPLVWLLRAVASRDRADALLGDLDEWLAERRHSPRPPRWPRWWLNARVVADLAAVVRSSLTRSVRTQRHILRDAWRSLRSTPGTTAFSLLILTIGIASVTVTDAVVDAVILRPFPFDSRDLVVVSGRAPQVAALEYQAWHDGAPGFESLAAYRFDAQVWPNGSKSVLFFSARTTASLFDVLGVRPLIGRTLSPDDERAGRENVVVIGYDFWTRWLGSDPHVLGRRLPFRNGTATVVGVMPQGFSYPISPVGPIELWTPYVAPKNEHPESASGVISDLEVLGRLRPRVSRQQAADQIRASTRIVIDRFPDVYSHWQPEVVTLDEHVFGSIRDWMLLVSSAVVLVMVVTCINVANLLLIRSTRRARELAVRTALGASRRQLILAMLVESLMLSLCATGCALVISAWGVDAARAALPAGIARASAIALNLRVLGAVVAAAIATAVLFGTVPAWHASRVDVVSLLKESATTSSGIRRRWGSVFLVAEVAIVSVLLVATTLFLSSFAQVVRTSLGFDRSHLIAVDTGEPFRGPNEAISDPLSRVAGVVSVAAFAGASPPLIRTSAPDTQVQRADASAGAAPFTVSVARVSPEYFGTAGIPILRGQVFEPAAAATATAVMLDTLSARQLFGTEDAVGRALTLTGSSAHLTVTAVVEHVRTGGPERESAAQAYLPIDRPTTQFLVRVAGKPQGMIPAIAAAVANVVGRSPSEVVTMDTAFWRLTATRRFYASLMAGLGMLALAIGAAGIYSVMASVVAQAGPEIGIRVALGATASEIARGVLVGASRHIAAGLGIGLVAAWWTGHVFTAILFDVRPTDASPYVIVAIIIATVGLTAAVIPARRASLVNPRIGSRGDS